MDLHVSPTLRLTKLYILTALTLLIIQNLGILFIIFIIRNNYGPLSTVLFQALFMLDILGFSLLGTGLFFYYFYKLYNKFNDYNILCSSLCILFWVSSTLFWRVHINFYALQPGQIFNGGSIVAKIGTINTTILLSLALSAGALFLATYFLGKSLGEKIFYEDCGILYSGLNLFLFIPLFGLVIKITVVPFLGILYFGLLENFFYKLKNKEIISEASEKFLFTN